jgi:pyruvate-ferredoxin/flavodoxin oxidoreductase
MRVTIDGNEAAASAAYRLNEVCCIYPITPSSAMAELADEWSAKNRPNIFGGVPSVIEMQSEGGAAGALHGSLQSGALTTTFTASQGLLLMIPNMYKIAGELTPAVFHVAARSIAAQGLSIFGDHSDVMAVRQTGFAMLCSASVQEAHDLAVVAQLATLSSRVPFVHFFDGFRTSHELNTCELLSDDDLKALTDTGLVRAHRRRALNPEHPVIRGTAQNPDTYFQARETVNPYYAVIPAAVAEAMDALAARTGRQYRLVEYHGHPEAERVIVLMGSAAQTAAATAEHLAKQGERVGVLQIRLFRPFPVDALARAIPPTATRIAVLDRTKEPGATGEPLFLDITAALRGRDIIGGRYGLSSKEFTPGMVAAVFDELAAENPRPRFTVGINDDVSGTSLDWDELDIEDPRTTRAVFFGIGSDGTVGANKNTIKILGDAGMYAQGYFSYDSRKSGTETVSHLRFGPEPISAPYLISQASFVGIHHERLLDRDEVLDRAAPGATVLINTPGTPELPPRAIEKKLTVYTIDADAIARDAGLGNRVNTILQTAFFVISGILPTDEAIGAIKRAIEKTYGRRGPEVVERNLRAVDAAVTGATELVVMKSKEVQPKYGGAPEIIRTMLEGHGDELPVSALPADGTYPTGTAKYEKRNISDLVAVWDPDACIQCGNCAFVCPHSVIRAKFFSGEADIPSAPLDSRGLPASRFTLQVYAEDCTGCGLCVEACPVPLRGAPPGPKAINLGPYDRAETRKNVAAFETIPVPQRSRVDFATVRGTQFLQPLFEFSGACAGCGETPYLRLLSQLFGDRLMVANATGCSSIYGGNLPTTPWTTNADGRGPAWANSLFEDNAEFGLGFRLAADQHATLARKRLTELRDEVGPGLADAILTAVQRTESDYSAQRRRVDLLRDGLRSMSGPLVEDLLSVIDHLVRRSVWIVGGDGWAYDIGSGGLDHVLASGRDVNVLVLDTEVYSNTGGQASKATPIGAVAKFAAAGKRVPKKDLALQAIAYRNVYVARVAMGGDPRQTLLALREAESYQGPSLVIAYSHCIAHGIESGGQSLRNGMDQQYKAVASGYWPLIRYDPVTESFLLDSPRPRLPLREYMNNELRFRILARTDPSAAEQLAKLAARDVDERWRTYEEMADHGA